jgi:hypothetical protein
MRHTGPGLVRHHAAILRSEDFGFRLFNFDPDSFHVKDEHRRYIHQTGAIQLLQKLISNPGCSVLVQGITSHTGGEQHNMSLALLRAQSIARCLSQASYMTLDRFKIRVRHWMGDDITVERDYMDWSQGGARDYLCVARDQNLEIAYRRAVVVVAGAQADQIP